MADKIIAVVGPTASGKTQVAVELSKRFGGCVLSADSMQIYQYMDIGTAKPTAEQMQGIRHYMIDVVHPAQNFTLADYLQMATECVSQILSDGKVPVIAGGTGLYVNSFVDNICLAQAQTDLEYREGLQSVVNSAGGAVLHSLLTSVDPEAAEKIHPNNTKRVIRALELYRATGLTAAEQNRRSKAVESPYDFCMIGLRYRDRKTLYERIDRRVDEMFAAGLEQEVIGLLQQGIGRDGTAFQAIGYKEFLPYFDGQCSLDEVRLRIQQESRRYAKRQLTWFGRDSRIQWFEVDTFDNVDFLINKIVKTIEIFLKT